MTPLVALRRSLPFWSALVALAVVACEREPATAPESFDLREFLPELGADGRAVFRYDSVVYDPIAGGTDRRRATGQFVATLDAPRDEEPAARRLRVAVSDSDGVARSSFAWTWDLVNEGQGLTHRADGITYLALVQPLRVGTSWDALVYTDRTSTVSIATEPVAIHKDWSTRLDSIAVYRAFDGANRRAAYVTYADSENRIELRRVREVYAEGLGLVERHVEILDTQNFDDLPWEQRAERGFTLDLVRVR